MENLKALEENPIVEAIKVTPWLGSVTKVEFEFVSGELVAVPFTLCINPLHLRAMWLDRKREGLVVGYRFTLKNGDKKKISDHKCIRRHDTITFNHQVTRRWYSASWFPSFIFR